MLYVARKRGLPQKFARFVLFRPIKKRSFNLLRILDFFSVKSVSDYFKGMYPLVISTFLIIFLLNPLSTCFPLI